MIYLSSILTTNVGIYIMAGVLAVVVWMFITVIAAKDYHPDLPRYKVKKINPRERDVTDKIFDDTNPPRFKNSRGKRN